MCLSLPPEWLLEFFFFPSLYMWKIIKIFGDQKKNEEMLWWSDAIEMLLCRGGGEGKWTSYSNPQTHKHGVDWKTLGGRHFPRRPGPPPPSPSKQTKALLASGTG